MSVRRALVSFYVGEHNQVVPRKILKGRTPDEVYFDRAADLPDRLSALRSQAQRHRIAHNQARRCDQCDPSASSNVARLQSHRKTDASSAQGACK